LQIKSTNAYLSDTAVITGTTFSAGYWEAKSGDVVINEVMWMGTNKSGGDDEWVELRNTTSSQIDLTGWKINLGPGGKDIILSGTIPSGGFFLITERPTDDSAIHNSIDSDQVYPTMTLPDSGRQLILKDSSDATIDQTPTGPWPAGDHHGEIRRSMERNGTPGDGALIDSWHTCTDEQCNDTTYWDVEGNNYGTPKAANLSENDLTLPDYITLTVTPLLTAEILTPVTEPDFSVSLNRIAHHLSFTTSNYPAAAITYEVLYQNLAGEQGIEGVISVTDVVGGVVSRDFYLGTCSSDGTCTPDNISIGSSISVNLNGQIKTVVY